MSNKELLDVIAALTAKVDELHVKVDTFAAETKAELSKLGTKRTASKGGAKKSGSASTAPSGVKFDANYMMWFKKKYKETPDEALELIPPTMREKLENYKNAGDEKYEKKLEPAKRTAEASFLWGILDVDVKDGLKKVYSEAKAAFEKAHLEPAGVENTDEGSSTATASDSTSATDEVVVTGRRRLAKRSVNTGE